MSDTDTSLGQLLAELTRSLDDLQSELEPTDSRLRPPTPQQLLRFTSDVTIPAAILVLETNIRALRLVQRALRIAENREQVRHDTGTQTRERAVKLGQATLSRLDATLADLQDALEGRPPDDDARQLLDRIQAIEDEIEAEMEASTGQDVTGDAADSIQIDVDAELQSLKDDIDGNDSDEGKNGNE